MRHMAERRAVAATPGIFITFEGGDGAGKSTHLAFLAEGLRLLGYEVVCMREPGGTRIGEELRNVVLDARNDSLCDEAELLIYEAARAQLVAEFVKPALEQGKVVLCDRFSDSTVAYQAHGRGLDPAFVQRANEFACQGVVPQRTVLMRASDDEEAATLGLLRAVDGGPGDRLEQAGIDFHARVQQGFSSIAAENPQRVRVVTSKLERSQTSRAVFAAVADLFGWDDLDAVFPQGFFELIESRETRAKAVVEAFGAEG